MPKSHSGCVSAFFTPKLWAPKKRVSDFFGSHFLELIYSTSIEDLLGI